MPMPLLEMPEINSIDEIHSLKVEDFVLKNYMHHPAIKAKMAIQR